MDTSKVLLIGIGNEFRRDDGIGIFIVRQIKKQGLQNVKCLEHQGGGVDLIEQWQGFKTVILFDAVSSGGQPGAIHRFEIPKDTIPKDLTGCSTHTFSMAEAIELAGTLKRLPGQLIVYGIEGKSFEMGTGLSSEAEAAARKVIEQTTQEIGSVV